MAAVVSQSLILTREELALLVNLLEQGALLGVEDPLLGLLADEAEEKLQEARDALVEQGCLEWQPDGRLAMDATVAEVVGACTTAPRSLHLSATLDGHLAERYIHAGAGWLVEQAVVPGGEVCLTPLRDLDGVQQRLRETLALPDASPAPGPAFVLPETRLTEARDRAAEGEGACSAFLGSLGVPAESCSALASTLRGPCWAGSVALLLREPVEMREGDAVAWLMGPRGTWRLHAEATAEAPSWRFVPADTAEIQRAVGQLVHSLA